SDCHDNVVGWQYDGTDRDGDGGNDVLTFDWTRAPGSPDTARHVDHGHRPLVNVVPATSHPRGGLSDVRRSEPWPVPPPSSQLRVQLAIVAITLWTVALVNAWTPSAFLRSGQLKGTDFVHFYAFSSMAATGDGALLYDVNALASRQAALVPEAAALNYPPV